MEPLLCNPKDRKRFRKRRAKERAQRAYARIRREHDWREVKGGSF